MLHLLLFSYAFFGYCSQICSLKTQVPTSCSHQKQLNLSDQGPGPDSSQAQLGALLGLLGMEIWS